MRRLALLTLLIGSLLVVGTVLAQTSTHYNLEWHVIGGGGQPVSSTSYAVNSTAGQGVIGWTLSTSYDLSAGYWFGARRRYSTYLPIIMKDYAP